jgi:uncharacterized protein
MMTKYMLATMASGLALMAAIPVQAQQGGSNMAMSSVQGPILSFSVEQEVRARPDMANIGAGVTSNGQTAVEALRANSAAMEKLVAAAKKRGIKPEDIQTSGINLSPQYDYNNRTDGEPPRFLGYQVSNMVRVTTDKIDQLGELFDTLIAAGGTNVDGPSFAMKDADAMLVPARKAVFAEAAMKAADYAKLAGFRAAELVSVTEGAAFQGPQPMPFAMDARAESAVGKAVVEPGQVRNTLTLNFQYRLVR